MAESRQNLHEATVTTDAVDYLPGWTGTTTTEASRVGPVSLAKTVAAGADSLTAIDPEADLKVLGVQDDGTPVAVNLGPAQIAASAFSKRGVLLVTEAAGDGVTDDTAAIQAKINEAIPLGYNVALPPGDFLVTGLELTLSGDDYRSSPFKLYGIGSGPAFGVSGVRGTRLLSATDAPIISYTKRVSGNTASGNVYLENLRIEQTNAASTSEVVYFEILSEYSKISHCDIKTAGQGSGIVADQCYKATLEHLNVLGGTWATTAGGTTRYGVGVDLGAIYDGGLPTLHKVTSRGFLRAFVIGGSGGFALSAGKMEQCESSVCTNGVWIREGTAGFKIDTCYFEGISGTCVDDDGTATTICDSWFYDGFAVGIDGTAFTYGNRYEGNYLEHSNSGTCTMIEVTSSGSGGGPNKQVIGNHLLFSGSGGSVANVRGIRINGVDPRIDFYGNAFDPRGAWTGGSGTIKIDKQSTGLPYGFHTAISSDLEFPAMIGGALSLAKSSSSISQFNVSGNTLTLPEGSRFSVNATTATTVNRIVGGMGDGTIVYFDFDNSTDLSIVDSAYIQMAGNASFAGPGILVMMLKVIGSTMYAREVSRSTL